MGAPEPAAPLSQPCRALQLRARGRPAVRHHPGPRARGAALLHAARAAARQQGDLGAHRAAQADGLAPDLHAHQARLSAPQHAPGQVPARLGGAVDRLPAARLDERAPGGAAADEGARRLLQRLGVDGRARPPEHGLRRVLPQRQRHHHAARHRHLGADLAIGDRPRLPRRLHAAGARGGAQPDEGQGARGAPQVPRRRSTSRSRTSARAASAPRTASCAARCTPSACRCAARSTARSSPSTASCPPSW